MPTARQSVPKHMTLARDPAVVTIRRFGLFSADVGVADFSIGIGINHRARLVNRFFHKSARAMSVPPGNCGIRPALGLTTVLGLAFDSADRLYVLENTTGVGNQFPTPGTGKVIRIDPSGNRMLIASGLFLPSAMTFGPDGALYVSNVGFGPRYSRFAQLLDYLSKASECYPRLVFCCT
jgi:hypothetical protein